MLIVVFWAVMIAVSVLNALTLIGFWLFMAGAIGFDFTYDLAAEAAGSRQSLACWVFSIFAITGFVVLVVGVCMWAWRALS